MAEAQSFSSHANAQQPVEKPHNRPRRVPLHEVHKQPLPVKIFPLPTFYPNNPLSWLQLAYAWLSQTFAGPPPEPSVVHHGLWSPDTHSVHIVDAASIRALWEQGFFGKGIYSRSEPNWLKREQSRRGEQAGHVAEIHTDDRRAERRQMKWDRARLEQEAIRRTKLAEAFLAPVSPAQLLALPNSVAATVVADNNGANGVLVDENSTSSDSSLSSSNADSERAEEPSTGDTTPSPSPPSEEVATEAAAAAAQRSQPAKRRKSVRFSSRVQTTSFLRSDPPSPKSAMVATISSPFDDPVEETNLTLGQSMSLDSVMANETPWIISSNPEPREIVDIEHLQLTPQEAFFLSYGLGALSIRGGVTTGKDSQPPFTVSELFREFRLNSYSPPREEASELQPDDPFLIHYVVYHHFRSLGWVPRPGIKFGVDWMIYHRGPAFSHAEFAIVVIPSYSDPYWKGKKEGSKKSWQWLHTVNRVQALAFKTLVLVYVDIPAPPPAKKELDDVTETLSRYRVREFSVKRWVGNRNRA